MAFGSGFEHFEVQKKLQRGLYMYPLKKIKFSAYWVQTPFTGVACWKLKGLAAVRELQPMFRTSSLKTVKYYKSIPSPPIFCFWNTLQNAVLSWKSFVG
jgi:hypothetical protein